VSDGATRSFVTLLGRSASLADRLAADAGLRPHDRIVAALASGGEHVELILAAWRLGLQLIAVPPTVSRQTFAGILDQLTPRAVVVEESSERLSGLVDGWAEAVAPFAASGDNPARAIILGHRSRPPPSLGALRPDQVAADWESWLARVPPALFYTSGSTSTAKGVQLRWSRILEKARAVFSHYGVGPDDRVMPILPLSHVYGVYCLLGALARGCDFILYRESAPMARFAEGLGEHAATVVICPPMVGAFLFARHDPDPGIRNRLRLLSMGGAAAAPEHVERIVAALPHTRVFLSYGLAETYSTICCNEVSRPGADPGSVGPLRFGAFGEARDPVSGVPVTAGATGELCVGGTIMDGYLGGEANCYTADGLFRTGDLVRFDADGAMTITGRLKEMINAGGLSINPEEIEQCLKLHPAVRDCGAFGEVAGDLEVACAAVTLREPDGASRREALVNELLHHCRAHLAAKMTPRHIVIVEDIPRGALGKIARAELRALCETRLPHGGSRAPSHTDTSGSAPRSRRRSII
jgi:acyl-CoA synthetase (AMP-forming)/AMP-acid ligase II